MSIPRSDLPHVAKLDDTTQRMAVDAMWQAFIKAEPDIQAHFNNVPERCPVSYVATMVEMLEAGLNVVQELDFPGQLESLHERAAARGIKL